MSKRALLFVGIDVSAHTIDVALNINGRWQQTTFENSNKGHASLVRYLRKWGHVVKVCIEATGIYHLDLALALHQDDRIEVMVVNPKAANAFAKAMMQRGKTDRTDAYMLANFAQRMTFTTWQPPCQNVWDLRDIARRSDTLSRSRAAEKNRLHSCRCSTIKKDIEVHIRHLDQRLKRLENAAMKLIYPDDKLLQVFTLLTTIKGVAALSAIRIMAELMMLPPDMKARQWVAHAGLDPRDFESGSSVKKRVRISKVGNIHLRNALYMPALSASLYDEHVKLFRETLAARGKTPMQGVVAVMRKLLHTIYGMLKNQEPYRSELFYQPMQNKA